MIGDRRISGLQQTRRTRGKLSELTELLLVQLPGKTVDEQREMLYLSHAWLADDVLQQAMEDGYRPTGYDPSEVRMDGEDEAGRKDQPNLA